MKLIPTNIRQRLGGYLVKIGAKMTDPRSWPNNAMEARDKASEAAVRGIQALDPLVDGKQLTEGERERRIGLAHSLFQLIARILEGSGARTRP